MRITADTNVLVRAAVGDEPSQAELAIQLLRQAECIAIAMPTLCEFVWVLRSVYGLNAGEIATALRALLEADNVHLHRSAVEAGLTILEAGGDFADGVIAHEGRWLGVEVFVSFDQRAVTLLQQQGLEARTP